MTSVDGRPAQAPGPAGAPATPAGVPATTLGFRRPRLRADLDVVFDGEDRAIFSGGGRLFFLEGRGLRALVNALDGTTDVGRLCITLRGHVEMRDLLGYLMRLQILDALREGPLPSARVDAAIFDELGGSLDRLGLLTVGLSQLQAERCHQLLADLAPRTDVHIIEGQATGLPNLEGAPLLVLTHDYLAPGLRDLNRESLSAEQPWLLARPTTTSLWVGPYLQPNVGPCWSCLAYRLEGHQTLDRYYEMTSGIHRRIGVSDSGSLHSLAAGLSFALTQLASRPDVRAVSADTMVTFDLAAMTSQSHPVVRRPECPDCGLPRRTTLPTPLAASLPKPTTADGRLSNRLRDAAATREDLDRHISPITGLVTSVVPVETNCDLFYGYAAGHDFAISRTRFDVLARTLRGSLSGGKGRTPEAAELGAICEAIERGLTVWRGDEPRVRGTYREFIATGECLDVDVLLGFSERQYTERERLNAATTSRYEFIPKRLDPDLDIDWVPVTSIAGERRLVPACLVYYGHPDMYEHWFCVADSNGTAAGGCPEEAIISGFCELVERDSVALWWYNRVRRPAIDLIGLSDPYIDAVLDYHARLGRSVWALDLTTDSGVPCFAVVSAATMRRPQDIVVGFGADLDPFAALNSAIDELNQFMPTLTHDEGGYWGADAEARDWYATASLDSESYMLPGDGVRRLEDFASLRTSDLADDVRVCSDIAGRMGSALYTFDLSRPEVDLAVVRSIVPGLRHFWRRLGPGRLYDTPVALGWRSRPLREEELNPRTVFF